MFERGLEEVFYIFLAQSEIWNDTSRQWAKEISKRVFAFFWFLG